MNEVHLTSDEQRLMLRRMMRIRRFEETAADLSKRGELPGPLHLSIGQEAEVVGACMALGTHDYMTGTHRSHGHPIGKGVGVDALMAELLGRSTGVCGGMGGSMHLADFASGSLGESGVVGAGLPIAVGAALSSRLRGSEQVALGFFGDGGSNTGPFHEALNLAAVWRLPVVFVCENNGYAVTTAVGDLTAVADIADRAAAYAIPGLVVDGQDPVAVWEATRTAIDRARRGEGPTLLDVKTYRYDNHAAFGRINSGLRPYRTDEEIETWRRRDPIETFSRRLVAEGVLDATGVEAMTQEVDAELEAAVKFARASSEPDLDAAFSHLYANPIPTWR